MGELLTTSSMRLSEKATSSLPSVGSKVADKSSHAKCTKPDNGIMAKKLRMKTTSGTIGVAAAATAKGRNTSKRFR